MEQWGIALDRCSPSGRPRPRRRGSSTSGSRAFQADPIAEIRALYDWLGDELTAGPSTRMLAWRADNPQDKYGKHEYDGAEFGITDERLAERFGAYRERFGAYL